jgi:hypothetical protein
MKNEVSLGLALHSDLSATVSYDVVDRRQPESRGASS